MIIVARKTNFTREMSDFYRSRKRQGLTNKQIAREMGISTSTLYRIKNRQSKVSARIQNQFKATVTSDDFYFTSYRELQRLSTSSNPRTSREASRAMDKIEADNPGLSPSQIADLQVRRPTVWRTVRGKRIGVLLGRSKQDEQREQVKAELRRLGVDPDETDDYYNEALQMSEGR